MINKIIKIFFGVILCGFGILLLFVFGGQVRQDFEIIQNLHAVSEAEINKLQKGDKVLIEGEISERSEVMVHNLVSGYREEYHSSSDSKKSYWEKVKEYNQAINLKIGRNIEVLVYFENLYPRGNYATIRNEDNSGVRWVGYEKGMKLCVVGIVESLADFSLKVDRLHGAYSREEWLSRLKRENKFSRIFGIVFLLLGAAILSWAYKR